MFARISTVHVPPSNVAEAFDLLAESMPDLEHMEELLSYSKHIYVQGRRRRGRRNNLMDPHFSLSIHGNNCTLHLMVYSAYTNQRLRRMAQRFAKHFCNVVIRRCGGFSKGFEATAQPSEKGTVLYLKGSCEQLGPMAQRMHSYGTHISSEKL